MQLRRALIAFAVVFAAVAIGAAISAPSGDEAPAGPSRPIPRTTAPAAVNVAFRQPVEGQPPVRPVRLGAQVVIRVEARVAGDVEVRGLGLTAAATPGTAAVFDVLASRVGRYEVTLQPAAGERTRLGFLEVRE
ncbi:MAG TPA: hypothetical protein VF715_00255 [Thermoleophilaceae bacterium]